LLAQVRELNPGSALTDTLREECVSLYMAVRTSEPRNVDACVGIGALLIEKDPAKAIEE